MAFAKIKTLECGLTLEVRSDENSHLYTPHFHVFDKNTNVGEVFVNGKDPKINKDAQRYYQDFQQVQQYVNDNNELFTLIYFTKDGTKRKELAKLLP